MEIPSREELIELCKDSVVHFAKWQNRDSGSSQLLIQSIYRGLTAGFDYIIHTAETQPDYHSSDYTYIIEFTGETNNSDGDYLEISTVDEYKEVYGNEHEMFYGNGIDFNDTYRSGYMPTRARLEMNGIGNDWY